MLSDRAGDLRCSRWRNPYWETATIPRNPFPKILAAARLCGPGRVSTYRVSEIAETLWGDREFPKALFDEFVAQADFTYPAGANEDARAYELAGEAIAAEFRRILQPD